MIGSVAVGAAIALTGGSERDQQSFDLRARGECTLRVWHGGADGPPVLFIHGATFPSTLSVSYRIGGVSWMDDLRRRGFDVWTFDFAGYGDSGWRCPTPAGGRQRRARLGRAAEAARQIERVVKEVLRRTQRRRLNIIAHSWGTLPAGAFAVRHPGQVGRLVLYGPIGRRNEPALPSPRSLASLISQRHQWGSFAAGVPGGEPHLAAGLFDAWFRTYLATDAKSSRRSPPAVRVPAGPNLDIGDAHSGHYAYDPRQLRVPVLIARGQWDVVSTAEDVDGLARAMTQVPGGARVLTLPQSGHRMHLELNRGALFEGVGRYLRE